MRLHLLNKSFTLDRVKLGLEGTEKKDLKNNEESQENGFILRTSVHFGQVLGSVPVKDSTVAFTGDFTLQVKMKAREGSASLVTVDPHPLDYSVHL